MSPEGASLDPPRVLLRGRPGSGKTTVVMRTIERVGAWRCAGFYTEEVRDSGRRTGFDVVTLDGRRSPLARTGGPGPRVGRYGVDLHSFEEVGLAALEEALQAPPGLLLVVDEIGKMELLSDRFRRLLARAAHPDSERPLLATAMGRPHPEIDRLERRADVQAMEVRRDNRDRLPLLLGRLFRDYLGDPAEAGERL